MDNNYNAKKEDKRKNKEVFDMMIPFAKPCNRAFIVKAAKANEFINHTNKKALKRIENTAREFKENQKRLREMRNKR